MKLRSPIAALAALALACIAPTMAAAVPAPHLALHVTAIPTVFSAAYDAECLQRLGGGEDREPSFCNGYVITVTNAGSLPAARPTITEEPPAGLAVQSVFFRASDSEADLSADCTSSAATIRCRAPASLKPDERLEVTVSATLKVGARSGEENLATVLEAGSVEPPATAISLTRVEEAPAPFGLAEFTSPLSAIDGTPATAAGSHPYEQTTQLDMNTGIRLGPETTSPLATGPEQPKEIVVDQPPGVVGSALATPEKCRFSELITLTGCPADTQVGMIRSEPKGSASVEGGLYNMVPEHGVAAELGYTDALYNSHAIYVSVAPSGGGYILRATTPAIPQIAIRGAIVTLFGDPSAKDKAASESPAFLTTPADCSGAPLTTTVHMDSWQHPGSFDADGTPNFADPAWTASTTSSPPVEGCEALHFEPTMEATPDENHADSPTGITVGLNLPQPQGFEERATPPLRDARITLPPGVTVNPSSANGLGACSEAEVGISASGEPDAARPQCPDDSKLGTVELETPALPGVLPGEIYLARQGENPFGSLIAIYIVVDDPITGVLVKIPVEVEAAADGRLTAVVENSPQFPFTHLRTTFFGGPRASLKTANVCGTSEATSILTPWSAPQSGPPATPTAAVPVSSGAGGAPCASSEAQLPNHPSFEAGTANPLAGAYSPFVLKLARADGSQLFRQVDTTLPEGLIGRLAGIPYCSEAQIKAAEGRGGLGQGAQEIASPSCPQASEVGTVTVGAGAGPQPFYATGHAYLAGPYKGAPLSLVVITPAVAGPFDLGSVVVRNALYLDEYTAQIHAVSDPFPESLHGIPLDIRSIVLNMDRPGFTLNPTSCEAKAITGSETSTTGQSASLSNRFQVGGCQNLGFSPKLSLSLKGPTKRAGHPALKAVVTYPSQGAYSNIAYAQVGLPGTEFLDQANLNKVCRQAELSAGTCPAKSVYGHAKAWSPLLEKPLEGPVYIGVGFGHKLPDLVAELDGQIRVLLHAKIDQDKAKGLRSTFEVVPDAPVSRFVLTMKGGPRYSLLENTAGVCAKPQRASVKLKAQNGIVRTYKQKIQNDCGKNRAGKHHRGKRHHRHAGHAGKHGQGAGRRNSRSAT
ncbi:MAG TPA: hypothetical protein VHZ54_10495 [Solirubrobacterales bacterium]|jgi:hypothetical protein|nr:hypothetical protein [Solirubrobacterales bacterium]